jgi:hypothetical protein
MSYEHTPDTLQPFSAGGLSARLIDVLYYLGAALLTLMVPGLIASSLISNRVQQDLVLVLAIMAGAVGLLCWGLCALLLYHHSEWLWPWPTFANPPITRREQAFVLAWMGFVGAAGFGALALLISTLGVLGLPELVWTVGAPIFIVITGAPAWIVWWRMRRRTQAAR